MKIKEVIIVEGKYDKIAIKNAVDAAVIETAGFGIFSDKEKLALIRRLAETRGIIVLTDSDGAGFVIRNYLKGAVKGRILHAYIPEIEGKERRKTAPSKENILGVEGMKTDVIQSALLNAGATVLEENGERAENREKITRYDLYEMGLTGGENSAKKRAALLQALSLPKKLGTSSMLEVLNILFTRREFAQYIDNM